MYRLATIPKIHGVLGDEFGYDEYGTEPSTVDQINAFANSTTGQNIIANLLNIASQKATGQPAVYQTRYGSFATPTAGVNPQWLIAGVVALGLLLYFNKK